MLYWFQLVPVRVTVNSDLIMPVKERQLSSYLWKILNLIGSFFLIRSQNGVSFLDLEKTQQMGHVIIICKIKEQ